MSSQIVYDAKDFKAVSNRLYGVFLEEINFAVDGGINNNQLINYDFSFRKRRPVKDFPFFFGFLDKRLWRRRKYTEYCVPQYGWELLGDLKWEFRSLNDGKCAMELNVDGRAVLENKGYNGGKSTWKPNGKYVRNHTENCAVGIKKDTRYIVQFEIQNEDFVGSLFVSVKDSEKDLTAKTAEFGIKTPNVINELKTETVGIADGTGKFVVEIVGKGKISFSYFYFGEKEYFGYPDKKWTGGRLRNDLTEAIKGLKPSFVRFPGGCIVEGYSLKNAYDWKDTVGELKDRKGKIDLWGESQGDGDYFQSNQIGFYEYFLLCEELKAEPLPVINAGLACQGRSVEIVKAKEEPFKKYVDDALDLIEFANGDPSKSKWAALRAKSGHIEPFGLKTIGIGNENWGDDYFENFMAIKKEIRERYPEIQTVFCVGFEGYGSGKYAERRLKFDKSGDDSLVDDHFYRKPQWALDNVKLYDSYPKESAPLFIGEFAANTPWDDKAKPNNFLSALSEAAFYTGVERNADVIKLLSYAPLFSRVGGEQWKHNLINFNSRRVLYTANYFVYQAFSENYGTKYIKLKDEPKGVCLSATFDEKFVYLKVVNLKETETTLSFSFKNIELNQAATVRTITAKDDYEVNELPYAGEPIYRVFPTDSTLSVKDNAFEYAFAPRSVNVLKIRITSAEN